MCARYLTPAQHDAAWGRALARRGLHRVPQPSNNTDRLRAWKARFNAIAPPARHTTNHTPAGAGKGSL